MSDSLRDQLLGLGFKPAPKAVRNAERRPERKPPAAAGSSVQATPSRRDPRPPPRKSGHGTRPARTREDIDLAKAYAIRAQREKDERIEAERVRQEEARQRREARARLAEFLAGRALNAGDAADHVRHFQYGGKIKRIHVTASQLKALNAGELGVVQQDGRYLLVDAETLAQCERLFAPAIALKVDPDAPAGEDPYADPRYQVPDDLVW